jgi:hypothetical protein
MLELGSIPGMISVVKEAASAAKAAGRMDLYAKILDLHSKINELEDELQNKTAELQSLRTSSAQLEEKLAFSGKLIFNGAWYLAAGDPHPYCPAPRRIYAEARQQRQLPPMRRTLPFDWLPATAWSTLVP